jgi:single-stranded DNA-binding protein
MSEEATQSSLPAVGFSIAADESFTDNEGEEHERVEWHHIVAFGKIPSHRVKSRAFVAMRS